MELRHLRYFVRVAEELHFGRAASLLGISQPPLSQQIRILEQELGVDLLDRTSRRVELTEAGRLFLAEARRTLDQAAHAVDVARRVQLGETGELAIGFTASVPLIPFVAGALFDYRAAHPAVHLALVELNREAQLARIADAQLDMGLVRGFEPPSLPRGLIARALLEEPLVVGLRDDHPLAGRQEPLWLADIACEPMVLYGRELGAGFNEHLSLMLRRGGHQLRVAQEVSGVASLLGLVAAGFGITILSRSMSILRTDKVLYRPLADPDALSRLWLVQRNAPSLTAQRFAQMLLSSDQRRRR